MSIIKPKVISPKYRLRLFGYYTPIRTLGYIAVSGTMLLALSLLSPHCYNNTYANDVTSRTIITPSVSIAMTEPGSIDITPSGDGQFGAVSSKLQVATTNSAGYSIYLNTLDQTNAMVNVNGNNKLSIQAIDSEQRPSDFKANTWGFALTRDGSNTGESPALTNLLYQPAPTTSSLVTSIPRATETDTYTLAFGANIDTSLPTGQYANTVLVSVVANPQTIRTLSDLTYMQEMSTLSCENSSLHETKQLIDLRDNKDYWVAKLADGNCWMTQNLALDLNEKTLPLKPESSDVSREWGPETYTETTVPTKPAGEINLYAERSWNLGKYVLATPNRSVACGSAPTAESPEDSTAHSVRPNQTIGQNCDDAVDVSSANWSPTFNSAEDGYDRTWSGTNYNYYTKKREPYTYTGLVTIDKANQTYDAHYLFGHYYQWNTAAAGTGGENISSPESANNDSTALVNAQDSICPKGWRLPTSGLNSTGYPYDLDDSFYQLLLAYGYPESSAYIPNNGNGYTQILQGTAIGQAHQNIAESPMYFVRDGYLSFWHIALRSIGITHIEWSGTAATSNLSAYSFVFDSLNIKPAEPNRRAYGQSVRCLAY